MAPPNSKVKTSFLDFDNAEDRVRELVANFAGRMEDPEEHVCRFCTLHSVYHQQLTIPQEWMTYLFPWLAVQSVSTADAAHPSVTFTFTVQPQHCNRLGNLRASLPDPNP